MDKEIKKTVPVKNKNFRELKGVVASTKMQKTVVVEVNTSKAHQIYKKRYTISKRYKAHDENNEYKVGDKVLIRQVRPLSKDKKWVVVRIIK